MHSVIHFTHTYFVISSSCSVLTILGHPSVSFQECDSLVLTLCTYINSWILLYLGVDMMNLHE